MSVNPNTFTETFGEDAFVCHIEKLIFERRATCVDDKNFHFDTSYIIM